MQCPENVRNNLSYTAVTFARKGGIFKPEPCSDVTWVNPIFAETGVLERSEGGARLPAYRHYRLDGAGSISKAEWFEAADDDDAVRHVREMKLPVASEIWDRHRRVARVDAADPS